MERAVIAVTGDADRLVAAGLEELRPVFQRLEGGVVVIGGLMTRIWLHARPVETPARATADVDLGINRRALRLSGDRRLIGPALREAGFEPRLGDEKFRFEKRLGGHIFPVDLGIAPGGSREEPPLLEQGLTTIAIPGLAYALQRETKVSVEFVDGDVTHSFRLPLPELDAAFVLKGALVASGVRLRPDRRRRDSVDAICLAAACLDHPPSMQALFDHADRSDVKDAVRWTRQAFPSPESAAATRVGKHFEEEEGIVGSAEWAFDVATRFSLALQDWGEE